MATQKISLLFAGGSLAERLLRNRGRMRHALAMHIVKKLDRALAAFINGEWEPAVSQRKSEIPISLTSWRLRLPQLPLVLLTLLEQSLRPKEILVWLTEGDGRGVTGQIKERFQAFGVRFETCDDLKPHKKWLPMIEAGQIKPFVICDDDIAYPPEWFEALVAEDRADAYVGGKCHEITWREDGSADAYANWKKQIQWTGSASHAVFITGCGGAVIHPERISKTFLDREAIRQKCPLADDVWLKAAHLAAGVPGYKTRYSFPCLELPGTETSGLAQSNVDGNGNDKQIANLAEWFHRMAAAAD